MTHLKGNQRGFTILELMIATVVLTVLLLIATTVFIALGKLYTKGVDGSKLQDNARGIMQEVTGAIQFSNVKVTTASPQTLGGADLEAYCVGSLRYSYLVDVLPGTQLDATHTAKYAIYEDQFIPGDSGCVAADLSQTNPSGGTEGKNLGLSNEAIHSFSMGPVTGVTTSDSLISVILDAYIAPGNDLLNIPPGAQSSCKNGVASQFCSTVYLSTVVQNRLAQNGSGN